MAGIIRRFKGKPKSSDKEKEIQANEESSSLGIKEQEKSPSLSPFTSDSEDTSPRHIVSEGSLFSGMKLTKTTRELEPESSPYTPAASNSMEDKSMFDFLEESSREDNPIVDEDHKESSGFSFLITSSPPPPLPPTDDNTLPSSTNQMETTGLEGLLHTNQSEEGSSGFSFLSTDPPDSQISSHQTDSHSDTAGPDTVTTISLINTITSDTPTPVPMDSAISSPSPSLSTSVTPVPSSTPVHIPPTQTAITQQKVGRQAPPNKKKKKHRAVRPGQERNDDIYSGLSEQQPSISNDLDGISINSFSSSSTIEPSTADEGAGKHDPPNETPTTLTIGSLDNIKDDRRTSDIIPEDNTISNTDTDENTSGTVEITGGTVETIGGTTVTTSDAVETTGGTMEATGGTTKTTSATMETTKEGTGGAVETSGTVETTGKAETTGSVTEDTGNILEITGEVDSDTTVAASGGSITETTGNADTVMVNETTLVDLNEQTTIPDVLKTTTAGGSISSELADVQFTESESNSPQPKEAASATSQYIVELSPMEKVTTLLEATESHSEAIRANIQETKDQYGAVLDRHSEHIKNRTKKRHLVQELRVKEAAALSEENYDLAEELRQELESIDVGNDREMLLDTQSTLKKWLEVCSDIVLSQVSLHNDVCEQLESLQKEQTGSLAKLEKEFTSVNAKDKLKLQTSRDELDREKGHISLDREHLEKRQLLLQEEISERATAFIETKKQLEIEERETQNEIQELEKKLIELKERQSDLKSRIAIEEESITSISREFSTEHEQIDLEQARLDKKEKLLQEKTTSLNKLRLSYDASLELHNKKKERIQAAMEQTGMTLTKFTGDLNQLQEALENSMKWELIDISEVLKPTDTLQSILNKEHSHCDQVKTATNEVLSLQSSISSCCKKVTDLEVQLQKLQEAKKVAVAARQYRDAAKLSAEEKQVSALCSESKEEVTKMEDELKQKNKTLLSLTEELEQLKEQRQVVEKEADIESIKQLSITLETVQKKLKSVNRTVCFYVILNQWEEFIKLLLQDLCTKHGVDIAEYVIQGENSSPQSSAIGDATMEDTSNGDDSATTGDFVYEERTPGVGMEKVADDMEGVSEELQQKIEEIEQKIAECCSNEEYEEAAILDEELKVLKSQIPS